MTVQRASDRARSLLERTCSRCHDIFRTVSRQERVYCETCRRRYGYPSPAEVVPCA